MCQFFPIKMKNMLIVNFFFLGIESVGDFIDEYEKTKLPLLSILSEDSEYQIGALVYNSIQ